MVEQNGPLQLTERQLAQAIDEKTFHRAQPYVREFTHRLRLSRSIAGRVVGPHGVYAVSLGIDGETMNPSCSCASDAGFCRHVIALGLTYIEEPESFYDLQTLTADLEQYSHADLINLILQMVSRHPETLGILGVRGFDDEEDDEVVDDDLYDDDDDDEFEDDEEELDDEEDDDDFDDDDTDEDDEEELSGGVDVESIYAEADVLLDEFQDYLKKRNITSDDRARYDEILQVFVDDYLAAFEVGKLTEMNRDEIDTYLREYLLDRERISKRKFADARQTLACFYTFLRERGRMPAEIADGIVQYCQR